MSIYKKLLEIQKSVDKIIKDGKNQSDKYDFASDENVLDVFRPLMDKHSLLLIPESRSGRVLTGETRSGTARFLTEMDMVFTWYDCESDETLQVSWYAQGVDLAGEKGVGKGLTYAEKYFLLKFFHVPTKKDDPDGADRTKSGELRQKGTAAAKENCLYIRKAITAMVKEIYGDSEEQFRAAMVRITKNDNRGYPGTDDVAKLSDAACKVLYGRLKKTYLAKFGREYAEVQNGAD